MNQSLYSILFKSQEDRDAALILADEIVVCNGDYVMLRNLARSLQRRTIEPVRVRSRQKPSELEPTSRKRYTIDVGELLTYTTAFPEFHPLGTQNGQKLNESQLIVLHGSPQAISLTDELLHQVYNGSTRFTTSSAAQVLARYLHNHKKVISASKGNKPHDHRSRFMETLRRETSGITIAYLDADTYAKDPSSEHMIYQARL